MNLVASLLVLTLAGSLMAQSPVKETLAYSRETTRGIPGPSSASASQNPIKVDYYIYIVVEKGMAVSASTACVRGKSYSVRLQKVETPVRVEHDAAVPTGMKDTLVKASSDDVYQVVLESPQNLDCPETGSPKHDGTHQVVVPVKSGESTWYSLTDKIVPLRPAAGS
jgi:hypothetical protein